MATCSETYGQGWTGDYPNCVYSPTAPPTTVNYYEELEGSSWEDDYQKFFDPYDPAEEERLATTAAIDIGQLQTAWDLKGEQLGEAWGFKRGELGAGAGAGYRKAGEFGSAAARKFGGAFSGTIADITRRQREDVSGAYKRAFGAGKTAYEQAMETGQLGLQQATTDIYQGMETDVFGLRKDWRKEQRQTLNQLLGSGIWEDETEWELTESQCAIAGLVLCGNVCMTPQECSMFISNDPTIPMTGNCFEEGAEPCPEGKTCDNISGNCY